MNDPNIQAEILAHSVPFEGSTEIVTFRLKLPTIILAELNTHRVFSRNSSSLRAIPAQKIIDRVLTDPFIPSVWTSNKPGMQGDIVTDPNVIEAMRNSWLDAAEQAAISAKNMLDTGVHKQIVNRILMPYLYTDTVMTTTELDNFFELRLDPMAEPHINQLAHKMEYALVASTPKITNFHVPYVDPDIDFDNLSEFDISNWMMISAARCARVSYTLFDGSTSMDKDLELAGKLFLSKHMSPFEHQALYSNEYLGYDSYYCRNFSSPWAQFRAILEEKE